MNQRNRYFKCLACGQVIQGWNASQAVDCCPYKAMTEIKDEADDFWTEYTVRNSLFARKHGLRS